MKKQKKNKKIVISVCAGILLILLYIIIFSFSAQDGEQSGSLSRAISEKCVEVLNSLSGRKWSQIMMEELAVYFEHPIRKLAHFSEYTCMGVLVYVLWSQWLKRGRALYLLTVVWVAISAAVDEIHQLFVPDRYSSFADVFLDTCGGAFGMLLCILLGKLIVNHRKRKYRRV